MVLSEQKIRAVVTNAKQMQKVQSLYTCSYSHLHWFFFFDSDGQGHRIALLIRLNANILLFPIFAFNSWEKKGTNYLSTWEILAIGQIHKRPADQHCTAAISFYPYRESPRGRDLVCMGQILYPLRIWTMWYMGFLLQHMISSSAHIWSNRSYAP